MKYLQGAVLLAVLVLANVVAAGVFLVLAPLVPVNEDLVAVIGMFLVGTVAVACSIFFIVGAMREIPRWLSALPRRS